MKKDNPKMKGHQKAIDCENIGDFLGKRAIGKTLQLQLLQLEKSINSTLRLSYNSI